jgi:hypothetical protein
VFPIKDAQRKEALDRQQAVIARAHALLAQAEERLRRSHAVLFGSVREEPAAAGTDRRAAESAGRPEP